VGGGWLTPDMTQVHTRNIREKGLVGVLCAPTGAAPAPGVLLLGGSEGGLHGKDAQILAAQGFTVLALAYFGAPGLPPGLIEVPLEYFFGALDLLARQPNAGDRFGALGGSRGGEAALLLASYDTRVAAVVSVLGSGVATQGIDYRAGALLDILSTPTNPWTLDGQPLPYLPNVIPDDLRRSIQQRQAVPLTLAFLPPPADPDTLDAVSIPVERTDAAILLLSADDDQMWPSTAYSQVAVDRLAAHSRAHRVEHRVFRGVGHAIAGPPQGAYTSTTSPGPGVTFELGGSPTPNTAARAQAWQATVEFLTKHLT
jgi:dienelactone hydrolase